MRLSFTRSTAATSVGLLVLAGCSGAQEPTLAEAEKTLEEYFDALIHGDTDACELETDRYAEENAEFFESDDCKSRMVAAEAMYEAFDVDLEGTTYEAVEADDGRAVVTATNPDGSEDAYLLVYEDDRWLIDDEYEEEPDAGDVDGDGNVAEETPDEVALPLAEGATIMTTGSGDGEDAPMFTVAFTELTCGESIPEVSMDDSYNPAPLIADDGNQICIVEVAATNESDGPARFYAEFATLRTDDDVSYSVTDKDFNPGTYLESTGQDPDDLAFSDVQPAETKPSVAAFELPADSEPVELVFSVN